MRTRSLLTMLTLAMTVMLATWWLGWPAPAVVGALIPLLAAALARADATPLPSGRVVLASPARSAALATLLGWGALLAWAMLGPRAPEVARMLGGLAGAHGATAMAIALLLLVLTLALGAGLAWAGAILVSALLGSVTASVPGRVTLSETAAVVPARRAERAPAAQTP